MQPTNSQEMQCVMVLVRMVMAAQWRVAHGMAAVEGAVVRRVARASGALNKGNLPIG